MTAHADPALETLFLPFADGTLSFPKRTLFLRARDGAPMRAASTLFTCVQTFKPHADALERAGFTVDNGELPDSFPLVLVLPPRQRDESRALLARAVRAAKGGIVVACAVNDEGAKSQEADLAKLAGSVAVSSKNKCRVFWASIPPGHTPTLMNEWAALDAPREICEGRYTSRPGIFAWDRIDAASALLVKHLPNDLSGRAADLGAGFGFLAHALLARCPGIRKLDLYEAELRALDLAQINLGEAASKGEVHFLWHDVTAGLTSKYDVILTNPPFHAQGSSDRPDIGRRFIAIAAQSLAPNGRLWLVANRHLPYESVLDANFGTVRIVAQEHGFKVIEAVRSPSGQAKR